jgi:prepilin-type N-terminal cleavage/methylation domain-containing protein
MKDKRIYRYLTSIRKGMNLVEMIIALAIVVVIVTLIVPTLRGIRNSWESKQASAETVQNSRVLLDHLNHNLSKAVRITDVNDSYIQFEDNDGNNWRYEVGAGNLVKFGIVGNLSDLAGPVSQLQFTCYDGNNFVNPTTDVNAIRFVDVNATFTNSAALGQDKTFTASIYLRTNANTNLMGWWKLDETSGLTAVDSSGKGNHGILVNGLAWVPTGGQIGGALVLDGSDDYVDLGADSSLNFRSSEAFTITAWIKTTDEYGLIVSLRNSMDDGSDIDFAVGGEGGDDDPGKAMILVRRDGGTWGWASVISGTAVNDGKWHHVAAERGSGSTVELFLDGVSQGTSSGSESAGAITTNVRAIGCEVYWDCGGDEYCALTGTVDDVRIYDRALTAEEIAQLANVLTYRDYTKAQ